VNERIEGRRTIHAVGGILTTLGLPLRTEPIDMAMMGGGTLGESGIDGEKEGGKEGRLNVN
jgi:hypothetical protein